MQKYIYTNLADSVNASDFSQHQAVELENGMLYDKLTDARIQMDALFSCFNRKKDELLIFTLNQIGDNPVLITDNIMTEKFYSLLTHGRTKISTYNGLDIIAYVQQRLCSSMQRIYDKMLKMEDTEDIFSVEPADLRFIFSVFPRLGESSYTRMRTTKMQLVLGDVFQGGIRKPETRSIMACMEHHQADDIQEVLMDILVPYINDHPDMKHGYFSAFLKVFLLSDDPGQAIETIPFVKDPIDASKGFSIEEEQSFRQMMRNLWKLNSASDKQYKKNDSFIKEYMIPGCPQMASYCKVIYGFLANEILFKEKTDLWLKKIPLKYTKNKKELVSALRIILKDFSQSNSGRSALYERIRKWKLPDSPALQKFLDLPADHHISPKSVMTQILKMAVDWTYNIHNAFLCSRDGWILEREFTTTWNHRNGCNGSTVLVTSTAMEKYAFRDGILFRVGKKEGVTL